MVAGVDSAEYGLLAIGGGYGQNTPLKAETEATCVLVVSFVSFVLFVSVG